MLLEEEVLSCGFFLVDLVKEQIECAIFALPPLLVRGLDGSITKVRGGNPPLGVYGRDVNSSILSLGGVTDLLIVSDGVTDAELLTGGSYREVIEADYRICPTLKALQREFQEKTDQESLDDLTMLHLRRLDPNPEWSWTDKPVLSLLGIGLSIRKFLDALLQVVNLTDVEQDELELILTEALTNALEHGCLGIDREEKSRLQNLGTYEEILEKGVIPPAAGIWFAAFLVRGSGKQLLQLEIVDNGPGLPDNFLNREADTNAMNGRGMKMIKRFSDLVSVGGPGGHVIISKTLEGEYGNAD
jgi:anti-sigma regulatory factor (Ser/Thr protein kinase)